MKAPKGRYAIARCVAPGYCITPLRGFPNRFLSSAVVAAFRQLIPAPFGQCARAPDVDRSALKALDDDAVSRFERRLALGGVGSPHGAEDLDRALVERALARRNDRPDLAG